MRADHPDPAIVLEGAARRFDRIEAFCQKMRTDPDDNGVRATFHAQELSYQHAARVLREIAADPQAIADIATLTTYDKALERG